MEETEKNNELQQPTKKERRFLKRQQREEERKAFLRDKKLKKILWTVAVVLIVAVIGFGLVLLVLSSPSVPESEIISKQGIHRHVNLNIKILGEYQSIPDNIGRAPGGGHRSIHTHQEDGVLHLEFSGFVKKDNIRLSEFFRTWGKKFTKECILDKCNGVDGSLTMLVNGELNLEFESYVMEDNDKIEIIFE